MEVSHLRAERRSVELQLRACSFRLMAWKIPSLLEAKA